MKPNLAWHRAKNQALVSERNLGFHMVRKAFEIGAMVKDLEHPGPDRRNQRMLLTRVKGYFCAVACVQDGAVKFLKTMYQSCKYDARYGESHGQENI